MTTIDAELARMTRDPAIADAGFTESVMHALPRRKMQRSTARRLSLGGAAVAGGALTATFGPPVETLVIAVARGDAAVTVGAALLLAAVVVPVLLAFHVQR